MGVGDDQFDATQAQAGELAQERRPERLGLGKANVHAEHFAPARTVGDVDPQIRPVALDRPGEECLHFFVDRKRRFDPAFSWRAG